MTSDIQKRIKTRIEEIKNERSFEKLKEKAAQIDWREKRRRVRAFFKNAGEDVAAWYKTLSFRAKRNLFILLSTVVITGQAVPIIQQKVNDIKQKKELKANINTLKQSLEEKHIIDSRENFNKLYEAALPLIQLSMFPTECMVLNPYSDNNSNVSNTIALGSYYYPKNGDPASSEWIKSADYFKSHPEMTVTGEHALDLTDGWYKYREGGRILRNMCQYLEGAELNVHEFAAIATVMYNSEKKGKELCKFVAENYKDPMKCAQKIAELGASKKFGGISKRHLHEAYLYLNLDGYATKLPRLMVKESVNSKGNHCFTTSVTQLSKKDVADGKAAIKSGNIEDIIAEQSKIVNYVCKGGHTVREIIDNNVLNKKYHDVLLTFSVLDITKYMQTSTEGHEVQLDPVKMYKSAIEKYNKAMEMEKSGQKVKAEQGFNEALKGFQKMVNSGYNGADLHNDMAITYLHLGKYKKCIEESLKVLDTGEIESYPAANYNAGKAYEMLGNYPKAIEHYQEGIKTGGKKKTFEQAKQRVQGLQQAQQANIKSR